MPRPRALKLWPLAAVVAIAALLGVRACLATPPLSRLVPTPAAEVDSRDPPNTRELHGSLYIARSGPSVIGFLSPGPARLVVGTREVNGTGLQTLWMLQPAGPIAIHFAGPPLARLVWSPVGRRGDPEYISASSLSPEPPETATFDHPGTAILDGLVALAILAIVIASACMIARRRLATVSRTTWIAIAVIFVAAVAVRWIDLGGHGQTWDEDVNWAAGRNYISNVVSLDASPDLWTWNFEHPPVMKYLAGIGAQFADGFGPARALSALWVALGCALLVPIGARIFSFRVGVLAAAIAALLPPLVAHGQIVGHESPTVMWWALGILLALAHRDGDPDRRTLRWRCVALGVVIGLAVASRFTNGLLGPLVIAILLIDGPRRDALDEPGLPRRGSAAEWQRGVVDGLAIMPPVSLATLYVVWPRLWLHPIAGLQAALAKLSQVHSPEPFLGQITNTPGPHYFLAYLVATLPIGILVGVIAWIVRAVRAPDPRATLLVAAWFVIPLGVALSPVRQDGVRYVMPCVLAFAMIGAAGWDYVASALPWRAVYTFGVVLAYLVVTLVRVHPYYLDFFGEQVGGAGNVAAHHAFETAWWGEGVDRAVDYVNANAPPGAHVYRECIEPKHLAWFRGDLWVPLARTPEAADWIVAYSPQTHRCPIPPTFTRVFSVDANGAILAEVWKR